MQARCLFLLFILFFVSCKSLFDDYKQPYIISFSPEGQVVEKNTIFTFDFSESMDPEQTASAFSLTGVSKGRVDGRVIWSSDNKKMQFIPYSFLMANEQYILEINSSAEDSKGNDIKAPLKTSFFVVGAPDERPRLIVSGSYPLSMQQGVPQSTQIQLLFSKSMDRESVYLGLSVTPVTSYIPRWSSSGGVSDCLLTLDIPGGLKNGSYTIQINENFKDVSGNRLYQEESISFTVGDFSVQPSIISLTIQKPDLFETVLNTENILLYDDDFDDDGILEGLKSKFIITFSQPLDKESFVSGFEFPVECDVFWETPEKVIIIPRNSLEHGVLYTLKLDKDKVRNLNGQELARDYSYLIRMGADLTPLQIVFIKVELPADPSFSIQTIAEDSNGDGIFESVMRYLELSGKTEGISQRPKFTIRFNKPVLISSFYVSISQNYTWSLDHKEVIIQVDQDLPWHSSNDLRLKTDIKAIDGNLLAKEENFAILIGDDYIRPAIVNVRFQGLSSPFSSSPLVKNGLIRNAQRDSFFEIEFTEEMDLERLRNLIKIEDYLTKSIQEFTVLKISPFIFQFRLKEKLASSREYDFIISEVTDIQGNTLVNEAQGHYRFFTDHETASAVELLPITIDGYESKIFFWNDLDSEWRPISDGGTLKCSFISADNTYQCGRLMVYFNKVIYPTSLSALSFSTSGNMSVYVSMGSRKINQDCPINSNQFGKQSCMIIENIVVANLASDLTLILKGGATGVVDLFGNFMDHDFEIDLKLLP